MGRRSPANERYQKHTAPAGKTRRSAAAAKPKRSSAAAPSSSSARKRPKAGPKEIKAAYFHPTTPEYKRLRKMWWILLGVSMALAAVAFPLLSNKDSLALQRAGNVVVFVSYGLIASAIYIDWAKMRPLRKAWVDSGKAAAEKDVGGAKTGKPQKTDVSDPAESSSADTKS